MHSLARAVVFALLPLLWSGLLVVAWHFEAYRLIFPLSLATLSFPASFGYAAILLLAPGVPPEGVQSGKTFVTVLCIAAALVAYACSLYATGSFLNLIPEYYKFGGNAVPLSRSTVQLWAVLTAAVVGVSVTGRMLTPSSSLANGMACAALGMSASTITVFAPLLLSQHVVFRQ
jgi:hypothetical protein